MKILRGIIIFFVFSYGLFQTVDLFARAGGGGRGGGGYSGGGGYYGGGYYHGYYYGYGGEYNRKFDPVVTTVVLVITTIFFGIALFGITFLMIIKNKSAKVALKKASAADSFWDERKMIEHGAATFHSVQEAWSKNDLSSINHLVTTDFFNHYQNFLYRYEKSHIRNILKDVKIETSKIVKIIDKPMDDQDTFLIYFKGKIIDYLVNTQSGLIVDGDKTDPDHFEDIYVFFRRGNKWLLNQIINDPSSNYMKKVKENKE